MAWLVAVVAAACLVGVLFVVRAKRRKEAQRDDFRRLCEALDLDVRGNRATGFLEGVHYELHCARDRGSSVDTGWCLRITVRGRSAIGFTILPAGREEDVPSRGRRLSEVRTGDVDFDQELCVVSDTPEAIESFFAPAVRRRAARKLVDLGTSNVRLGRAGIEARWSPFDPADPGPATRFTAAVSHLLTLLQGVPGFFPSVHPERKMRVKIGRALVQVVPALFLAAGAGASFWGARRFPPIDLAALALMAVAVGVLLFVLSAMAAWALLRGARMSGREGTRIAALSVPAFLFTGLGLCLLLNGLRDPGPTAVRTANVSGRSQVCLYFCSAHAVEVGSWRPGRKSERVPVSLAIYRRAVPGRRLLLTTKPGWLGVEWVLEVSEMRSSVHELREVGRFFDQAEGVLVAADVLLQGAQNTLGVLG